MLPSIAEDIDIIAYCPYRSAVCTGDSVPEVREVQQALAEAVSVSHLDNHSVVVYTLRGDDVVHVLGRSDNFFYVGHLEHLRIFNWDAVIVFDEKYTERLLARKID